MKIAIITSGNPNNMKGVMNYVQEKVSKLQQINYIAFSFYMIRRRDSLMIEIIKRKRAPIMNKTVKIQNVNYKNIWIKHDVIDYVLSYKMHLRPFGGIKSLNSYIDNFSSYDIISTHTLEAHYLALKIKQKYNIPFITTWHGSDINVNPFLNKTKLLLTKQVMEEAYKNFFVSKRLLETSNKITDVLCKEVLYTGPSESFYEYKDEIKFNLRAKHNISSEKIVGFIGNLVPVKNILILPEIFSRVIEANDNIIFWIIGDGPLENSLKIKLEDLDVNYKMFGKVAPSEVPDLINCIDILVLPSLNEGLPLVTLEAISSGVNVVGSNVGGILESIGKENVFDLDNNFAENISNRIIEILKNNEKPKALSKEFSWERAIEKEINTFKEIIDE